LPQKCTKFDFGGAQTPLGSLQHCPGPPSWILGAILLREGEGKGGESKGKARGAAYFYGRGMGEGKEGGRRRKEERKVGTPKGLVSTNPCSKS